jgi:uncharacterized repeat protein (TIGR01451 family)
MDDQQITARGSGELRRFRVQEQRARAVPAQSRRPTIPAQYRFNRPATSYFAGWLLALALGSCAAPVFAQTCTALTPILNPTMAGGTAGGSVGTAPNWTATNGAVVPPGPGWAISGAGGAFISNDYSATPNLTQSGYNSFQQTIQGGVVPGSILQFEASWGNGGGINDSGRAADMEIVYSGVVYAIFETSNFTNVTGGATGGASAASANGAVLNQTAGVPWASSATGGFRTYQLTLPAGVPQGGVFQVRSRRNDPLSPANGQTTTDDHRFRNPAILSPTVCLTKTTARGTGSFTFTTTNADTVLGNAGVDTSATINVAAANTPTTYDAWAGAAAPQAGNTPLLVTSAGATVTIAETPGGFGVTNIACTGNGTATRNGDRVTITGITASTTPANCTFTNTRPRVRLQKTLPDGRLAAADQFALSIAGPSGGVATTATATTTGAGGTATAVADFVDADAGGSYMLSEAMAPGSASALTNYGAEISCTNANAGSATALPTGDGTSFNLSNLAAADDITCTFTNTPRTATLTLRKQWSGAEVGDDATITVSRGATVIDTFNSDAGAAGELDADATPTAVVIGETLTLAEALATAKVGLYDDTLACTGSADTDPADGLTIGAADTAIVCTYSNTRRVADLSITKTNTPTVGALDQANDTVDSGQATTYTLVVTNDGATAVTGAVVRDAPGAGITCPAGNAVTISGDGVPAGSFTVGDLTGANGIMLGALAAGQSATLSFNCQVN